MKDYFSYKIPIKDDNAEVLSAWFSYYDFDTVVEESNHVVGFLTEDQAKHFDICSFANQINCKEEDIIVEKILNKNWNAEWEANFDPIIVEDQILIYADFHNVNIDFPYSIKIAPKMAFGTGHHNTTYMMLDQMRSIDFEKKSVFDFGCGTGILSVFALQRGASDILAIDIEEQAQENTLEHFQMNGFGKYSDKVKCGGLETIESNIQFDVILANINRNVLSSYVDDIFTLLVDGGMLLMSGILETDFDLIKNLYTEKGFHLESKIQKGQWLCLRFKKDKKT